MKRKKLTKAERQFVYDKYSGHCAYCGRKIKQDTMQVDHVIPLKLGGKDVLDNMFPACSSCNHFKSSLRLEVFRKRIERLPELLMKDTKYKDAVRFGLVIPNWKRVVFYFEKENETDEMHIHCCEEEMEIEIEEEEEE